MRYRHNAYTIH